MKYYKIYPDGESAKLNPCIERDLESLEDVWLFEAGDKVTEEEYKKLPEYMGP